MQRCEREGIEYLVFDLLEGVTTHAIFTRHGGTSPDPWRSLNVGRTVGDDPERVEENKRRAFESLGCDPASRYDVWQVHGVEVAVADAPRPSRPPIPQADAVLTDRPGVTLFMRFADCVPVMLFDPRRRVVGMVHAGWMGTVAGIVGHAVKRMEQDFGSKARDVLAAIGPSIGPDHYEVGQAVVEKVRQVFGEDSSSLLPESQGRVHFDLWQANRLLLERAGVRQVELARLCTACEVRDFYSHRLEQGRTGRFGALIALAG